MNDTDATMTAPRDWEITHIKSAGANVHVTGINHCASDEMNREFHWTFGWEWFTDPRFFLASGCTFDLDTFGAPKVEAMFGIRIGSHAAPRSFSR